MKKKLIIGDLVQVGTCDLATRGKSAKGWPVLLILGLWGLTPHFPGKRTPDLEYEWLTITHLPTGYRAGDMRVDDPRKKQKLAKFVQMFGGGRTVEGVQRKYRKLSRHQKLWINRQVAWLLPAKAVRP